MSTAASVVAAAHEYATSNPPKLRECFHRLKALNVNMDADEFKALAPAMDAVWDAAWSWRRGMKDLKDLNSVGTVAVQFVDLCSTVESFRPWDSSHLPHLLLYCAVKLRNHRPVDPFIEVLCRLMHDSPGPAFVGTSSWGTLLNEVQEELGTKALSSVFLRILNRTTTHFSVLQAAMELGFPMFLREEWSSRNVVPVDDVLDSLYSAAHRTVENTQLSTRKKAGILCTFYYFEWDIFKCGHTEYLRCLLSGRYDVFGILSAGLLLCRNVNWDKGDNPEFVYGTLERLLLAIEGIFDSCAHHGVSADEIKMYEDFANFKSTTKELARKKMPALLAAVTTPPTSPIQHPATPEAMYAWNMLRESLICFSINLRVHPYCANLACEYRGRPLPEDSGANFKQCGGCMNARYCSKFCQKIDRWTHKRACGKHLKAESCCNR
ncbi:unnamed protein product [Peniophora sp. CBMAI 1063]|nr:unnamed protein product [Peniophora sp. CBMAI 1063]